MITEDLGVSYGDFLAVSNVNLGFVKHEITALIGPSGCGKSTFVALPQPHARSDPAREGSGTVESSPARIYTARRGPGVSSGARRHGLPEAQSLPDDVHLRQHRTARACTGMLPRNFGRESWSAVLRRAALWDEVKDKLNKPAWTSPVASSSGSALPERSPSSPEVSSNGRALPAPWIRSPRSKIEDLMRELQEDYTIVIVTHNMQQAARVSDRTAFFTAEDDGTASASSSNSRHGEASRTRRTRALRPTSPDGSADAFLDFRTPPDRVERLGASGGGGRR